MQLKDLIRRVRSLTRDFSEATFRESDIVDFLNEGVDRMRQVVPEFGAMKHMVGLNDAPVLLPDSYHSLLALYASSRCFTQDDRHFQAGNLMNEFEEKLERLRIKIEDGEVIIVDENGARVDASLYSFYVVDNYFEKRGASHVDLDDGVDGVE